MSLFPLCLEHREFSQASLLMKSQASCHKPGDEVFICPLTVSPSVICLRGLYSLMTLYSLTLGFNNDMDNQGLKQTDS